MNKVVLVLSLLVAVPCNAQQGTTAELTGRVTSAGQALPGVTVTLSSNSLPGTRSTVTGENGGYRFTLLPPAAYLLHFELQGFTAAEKRVHLSLAETGRADVELAPAPLREEIVVQSDSERVAGDASIGMNLRAPTLEKLPGARDIRAAVQLSPNVNALGPRNALIIAGAPSWDSLYLADGVAANEYLSGQPHDVILEDAIQEVAVLTGAISAEYGRFTGGVVSTLTKSGGNTFSGSLRDTVTNAAWTRQAPWPDQPDPLHHVNHAVEGTLGGFLLKDRLWFFAAGRNAQSTVRRFTSLTNIAYPVTTHDQRWEGKITDQITPRHAVIGSYAKTALAETNVTHVRTSGEVLDLGALIFERWQPTRLVALTYNGALTANSAAEIQYSQKRYALRGNGGRSIDRILGTLIVVQGRNLNAPFGCGICGDDERHSNSWSAKTSNYWNTGWGNHTAVIGGEGFRQWRTNAGTRSASEFNIQATSARVIGPNAYPFFGPSTMIIWTHHYPGDRGSNLKTSSAFLNDRWDVNSRWTLNLGLRYDHNDARDAAGRTISKDAAFSPRLSATFDLRSDGRHQLRASYGRYSAKILEGGGAAQQVGIFDQYGWRYSGPTINGPGVPAEQLLLPHDALSRLFAWFDSVGGIQNRGNLQFITNPDASTVFHGSLKSPSVDERSVGYAMQFPSGSVRIDAIARDWHNFYAVRVDKTTGQQTNAFGNTLDLAWIINDDSETVRTYRAIQLQGSWRHRKASIGGGYTWSKLRGNDDEEEEVGNVAPRNCPLRWCYPELLGYPQRKPIGYLKQDARHRARVWISYDIGPLSASLLQWFDSGHPYSAVATIDPKSVLPNPGYALNLTSTAAYFFSARGAFRTDDVYSTGLSVQYEVPVRGVRLFAKGDVLNVFNNAAVIAPGTEVADRFNSGTASGLLTFNPFTEVPVEGVHYRLSPSFGQPTGPESYQTPRTFQVAIGARF
ncbi:MAG TPA: TonB-dependent receptor [Thermoanaerobaculia bacterium]